MKIEYKDALNPDGDFEGNQKAQQDAVIESVEALMLNGFCFKGIGVDSNVRDHCINLLLYTTNILYRESQKISLIHAYLE